MRNFWRRSGFGLIMGITLGCGEDSISTGLTDAPHLYRYLVLNHHAVTLSVVPPHNTVQLTATPYNAIGEPLPGIPSSIRYTIMENDISVSITEDGIVTALAEKSGVRIDAAVTMNGVTWKDSVWINIRNAPVPSTPPLVDSIGIRLSTSGAPTESLTIDCSMVNKVYTPSPARILATAYDEHQEEIPDVKVALASADSQRVRIRRYTGDLIVSCLNTGPVWLYATTTVYGKSVRDSLLVIVTPPRVAKVVATPISRTSQIEAYWYMGPGTVEIAAGGTVIFENSNAKMDSVSILFDDPDIVVMAEPLAVSGVLVPSSGSGNIMPWSIRPPNSCDGISGPAWLACAFDLLASSYRTRKFPHPGTYRYRTSPDGSGGTIVVK